MFVQTKKNKEIMESNSTGGLISCLVRDKVIRDRTSSAASSDAESVLAEQSTRIQEVIDIVIERTALKQEIKSASMATKQKSHDARQVRTRTAFTN